MSETLPITIKDAYPIDISSAALADFPQEHLLRFKDEAESAVEDILTEFGVSSEEDVHRLPTETWAELRRRLLAVKIKLHPSGEIIHE